MAYAPQAILDLFTRIKSELTDATMHHYAENSGIVGDVHHSFGYHLARNELPSNDYSVVLAKDRLGDASASSALDIKPGGETSENAALMITVTKRLLAAAKAGDPRLAALREFCGTTDGRSTHPYDLSNGQDGPLGSWDASHLWHVHLSIYREYANDFAAIAAIADVIAGIPLDTDTEEEMALSPEAVQQVTAIVKEQFSRFFGTVDAHGAVHDHSAFSVVATEVAPIAADVKAIKAKVGA